MTGYRERLEVDTDHEGACMFNLESIQKQMGNYLLTLSVCSCMLSTLSIRTFRILIIVVLHSQSDNSHIPTISETDFDACSVSSNCGGVFFGLLVCL